MEPESSITLPAEWGYRQETHSIPVARIPGLGSAARDQICNSMATSCCHPLVCITSCLLQTGTLFVAYQTPLLSGTSEFPNPKLWLGLGQLITLASFGSSFPNGTMMQVFKHARIVSSLDG